METDYFKGKKVTLMGLGLLGRGIGDAAYLAEAGVEKLVVTDMKTAEQLESSVAQLQQYPNIHFVLGEHKEEDFKEVDLVVVAAGVPTDSPYLAIARAHNVRLVQSAALFAEISRVPIIGITGTRGKSTTTHIIHHVLSVTTGELVLLGGNVRGVSNLQLLKEATEDSLCVMELDSWQLQGFGWAGISPQVAVFTNFMSDHLNYYTRGGVSEEEALRQYFTDKAQIFLHQEGSGVFITTPEVFALTKKYIPKETITGEVILTDTSVLPDDMLLSMPGEHNRLNAALAYQALKALGLNDEEIFAGLASFPGVEGRLQYLGLINGAKVYNDNNATTAEATVVGLRAVGHPDARRVVLICGGDDKNLDMDSLVAEIPKWCKAVVLFSERGTDRIRDAVMAHRAVGVAVYEEEGLLATVQRAAAIVEPGDTLLYSPAFSSFGKYFKNEYDRSDQFATLIATMQEDNEVV